MQTAVESLVGAVAQLARAVGSQSTGRGFEPHQLQVRFFKETGILRGPVFSLTTARDPEGARRAVGPRRGPTEAAHRRA
jgi:hypothetical protein